MYKVVFAYTAEAGGYEGVMTSCSFESKEAFDQWYTPELKTRERVVAEGVSDKEAERLCLSTPMKCYIAAAYEEATDPDTGEVNQFMFEMHMDNALMAKKLENPNNPDLRPENLKLIAAQVILERSQKRMEKRLQNFAIHALDSAPTP